MHRPNCRVPVLFPTGRPNRATSPLTSNPPSCRRAAVLLEVVLSLALFTLAATVIATSFQASFDSLQRLRLNTHAANLAVTLFSQLQSGLIPFQTSDPEPFEAPFENWTWSMEVSPFDDDSAQDSQIRLVVITVRHLEHDLFHQLAQLLFLPPPGPNESTFPLAQAPRPFSLPFLP